MGIQSNWFIAADSYGIDYYADFKENYYALKARFVHWIEETKIKA